MSVGAQVGAYRILDQLGEGGMGTVWLAEHVTIGRKAAVKMLHGEYTNRREIVQRFFNEARAATQISDPGIVQIFDFGTTPEGYAYIVMELLEGEALDRRLQRGKLSVHDALRIIRQAAATLGAAHARGIVHRDIKPENIYMVRDPEVPGGERAKILDFGIAKLSDNAGVKTQTNAIMGTPMYMSPEQCRGAGGIDARSDVYALGCLFFALVTGTPPFVAEGHGELIVMHLQQPPPLLSSRAPHVPAALEALVMKCLAKDPNQRYATGTDLAQAIGMLIASTSQPPAPGMSMPMLAHQQPTVALSPAPVPTTLTGAAAQAGTMPPPVESGKGLWIGLGAVVAIAVALVAVFVAKGSGGSSAPTPTAAPAAQEATATPPAPVPTPAPVAKPEPAPAKSEKVTVTIESKPSGAQVFVDLDKTPRGKTPYALELDKGSAPVEVKVVHKGYLPKKTTVNATADTKVSLALSKVPVVTSGGTSDSDDTMNPFAKKK